MVIIIQLKHLRASEVINNNNNNNKTVAITKPGEMIAQCLSFKIKNKKNGEKYKLTTTQMDSKVSSFISR